MDRQVIFRSSLGWVGLVATDKGISRILLPRTSRRAVEAELGRMTGPANGVRRRAAAPARGRDGALAPDRVLDRARAQLTRFLDGEQQGLDFPLDLSRGTAFQRRVWRTAQRIPFGRARTYGWIAARVGGPQYARAVGHALGVNPVPFVVPCHRVLGRNGSLTGFAGGLRMKRRLLELEGTLTQLGAGGRVRGSG